MRLIHLHARTRELDPCSPTIIVGLELEPQSTWNIVTLNPTTSLDSLLASTFWFIMLSLPKNGQGL